MENGVRCGRDAAGGGQGQLAADEPRKLAEDHVRHGAALERQRQLAQRRTSISSLDRVRHTPGIDHRRARHHGANIIQRHRGSALAVEQQPLDVSAQHADVSSRVFEQRLKELGGKMPDRMTEEFQKNVAYLRDRNISDLEKLQRGAARFPNPEETIRPLFEFADLLKEDLLTKEMVRLFAQDELSTLKWQNGLCEVLTKLQKQTGASAAA